MDQWPKRQPRMARITRIRDMQLRLPSGRPTDYPCDQCNPWFITLIIWSFEFVWDLELSISVIQRRKSPIRDKWPSIAADKAKVAGHPPPTLARMPATSRRGRRRIFAASRCLFDELHRWWLGSQRSPRPHDPCRERPPRRSANRPCIPRLEPPRGTGQSPFPTALPMLDPSHPTALDFHVT